MSSSSPEKKAAIDGAVDAVLRGDSTDPYSVMDGGWAGDREWFTGRQLGATLPADAVAERQLTGLQEPGFRWRWARVWIPADGAWRPLSTDEATGLPPADS